MIASNENGFIYTTAIKKLRKLSKRVKVIPGGTSAGKTYGILPILIDTCIKTPLLEVSVVSESIPHIRRGALKDFLKIMKQTGRYIDANYNRTLLTYTFANGSYIEFFSADQEDKVRGPRRNILYINECDNLPFETYHQLAIRTDMQIWLDYNPTQDFWVDNELVGENDTEVLVLTYKDNEALSESIVKEIEKAKEKAFNNPNLPDSKTFSENNIKSNYWSNWWKVYGLGLKGSLQGVIFNNWGILDELPEGVKLLGRGLDFGFTNSYTALVSIYEHNDSYIIDENLYERGLYASSIYSKVCDEVGNDVIYCDHAQPMTISELNDLGLNTVACEKPKDGTFTFIDTLSSKKFYVTKRSVNTIKELRFWCWETDKKGVSLNKPIKNNDHSMDAIKYVFNSMDRFTGSYVISTH